MPKAKAEQLPQIMLTLTFTAREHPTIKGLPIAIKADLYDGRATEGHVEDASCAVIAVEHDVREALRRIGFK